MELLASAPRILPVNEPLRPAIVRTSVSKPPALNDWPRHTIAAIREGSEEDYRRILLDHRVTRICGPYDPFASTWHPYRDRRVLKIVHGPALGGFIADQGFMVVHLIRHPVAAALSMIRTGNIFPEDYLVPAFCENHLSHEQAELAQRICAEGDDFERCVLEWALGNLALLRVGAVRDAWTLVTYEELVLRPVVTLRHLTERLDLPFVGAMVKRVGVPSASTGRALADAPPSEAEDRLNRWRKHVSADRSRWAVELAERFDIDVYAVSAATPRQRYLLDGR